MAKFVKIQPNETVDAMQLNRDLLIKFASKLEDFYYTSSGQRGLYARETDWLVEDNGEQGIWKDHEFQRRFKRVEDTEEQPAPIIYDPRKYEWVDGKLVERKLEPGTRIKVCRKCGQTVYE